MKRKRLDPDSGVPGGGAGRKAEAGARRRIVVSERHDRPGRRVRDTLLSAMAAVVTVGCAGGNTNVSDTSPAAAVRGGATTAQPTPAARETTAVMRDAAGRELGALTLTSDTAGITVAGSLRGLAPGSRAIHLHAVGRCEPPFDSAGPHWNPTNRQHGSLNPNGPHFGDLPNITVRADSAVDVNVTTAGGRLTGPDGLLDADGGAVVMHQGPDDNRTDPAGNAGARIACGVVRS